MSEPALDFTEEEVQQMLDDLDIYTPEEVAEINTLVDELATRRKNQAAYDDLIESVSYTHLTLPTIYSV